MSKKTEFTDEELARYSRQILLPNFDVAGQLDLANSRVLVVGLGGLGSAASYYLAASGVGHLTLVDGDTVDLSNLQRQIVHTDNRIGQTKVASAAAALAQINPHLSLQLAPDYIDASSVPALFDGIDLVLDCSDNFDTRLTLNKACIQHRIPLVSGAAIRCEGQISVFDFRDSGSPCYQCLYGMLGNEDLTCSENGVLSPLVGIIGSAQALEAIKILSQYGESLKGRVLIFDGLKHQWREFKLQRDDRCPGCGEEKGAQQYVESPYTI